jgi:hypothetical protein
VEWIIANLEAILLAVLGTQALAQLIVNLTPTPRDDVWAGKVYRVVEVVAGLVTPRAKEVPPNRTPQAPAQLSLDLPDINVRF